MTETIFGKNVAYFEFLNGWGPTSETTFQRALQVSIFLIQSIAWPNNLGGRYVFNLVCPPSIIQTGERTKRGRPRRANKGNSFPFQALNPHTKWILNGLNDLCLYLALVFAEMDCKSNTSPFVQKCLWFQRWAYCLRWPPVWRLLARHFKVARCGFSVLIQNKQAACDWGPLTTGWCIYFDRHTQPFGCR